MKKIKKEIQRRYDEIVSQRPSKTRIGSQKQFIEFVKKNRDSFPELSEAISRAHNFPTLTTILYAGDILSLTTEKKEQGGHACGCGKMMKGGKVFVCKSHLNPILDKEVAKTQKMDKGGSLAKYKEQSRKLEIKWENELKKGPANEKSEKLRKALFDFNKKHFPVILSHVEGIDYLSKKPYSYGEIDWSKISGWSDSYVFNRVEKGFFVPNEIGEKIKIRTSRGGGSAFENFDWTVENVEIAKKHLVDNGYLVEVKVEKKAEGGPIKVEKWISDAIEHKGILRKKAKSMGLIKDDETLSEADLDKLEALGGVWIKRVNLARNLKHMESGGFVNEDSIEGQHKWDHALHKEIIDSLFGSSVSEQAKQEVNKAKYWWSTLSINEQKALKNKYFGKDYPNESIYTKSGKNILYIWKKEGSPTSEKSGNNDITTVIISSKAPLSTTLYALTGKSWNAIDFEEIDKTSHVFIEKATGRKFIAIDGKEALEKEIEGVQLPSEGAVYEFYEEVEANGEQPTVAKYRDTGLLTADSIDSILQGYATGMTPKEKYELMKRLLASRSKMEKGGTVDHDKVGKVMHEFKMGTLKTSNGELVTDRKQAIAIALNEAGLSKYHDGGQLKKGIKVEKEHANTLRMLYGHEIPLESGPTYIAKDHPREDPSYYTRLEQVEKHDKGGSVYPPLRSVKVTYDNGEIITTSMAANLSDEEIREYFAIDREFNIGSGPHDKMAKVKSVEILDSQPELYAKGGDMKNIWDRELIEWDGKMVPKPLFDVNDMVYSWQNPSEKRRVSFKRFEPYLQNGQRNESDMWKFKVSLIDENGYSHSSKWMGEDSLSFEKKDSYAKGGAISYFSSIDRSLLPEPASEYIDKEILADESIALLDENDPDLMKVKELIAARKKVEPEPAPQPSAAAEKSEEESWKEMQELSKMMLSDKTMSKEDKKQWKELKELSTMMLAA